MAPSFDCLLCGEDDNSIFGDNNRDYNCEAESEYRHRRNGNRNRSFDDGLPLQSHECLVLLLEKETQHLPKTDYLNRLRTGDFDLVARKEAFDWIDKAIGHFNFGPLCAYLTLNYLDRFLSAYELPKGRAWMMQLLAVTCLSLAAKMEESEVPLSLDLQTGESKFLFEARTIQRMELLVLSTLKWRMQAITPFSFIDYFIHKINDDDEDNDHNEIPLRTLVSKSTQLILSTTKGIDFLEFKPSEIAAAVAISVAGETKTVVDADKAVSALSQYVQKEKVIKCIKMLDDLSLISGGSTKVVASSGSVPHSPIGVLDAACLSYKSDDTSTTTPVGSCTNSSHNTPDTKRRKLNRPCEVVEL